MATFRTVPPEQVGWDPERLQRAYGLLDRWVQSRRVLGAGVCVGGRSGVVEPRVFGRQSPEPDSPALAKDALFLVASISKPVTVTAVMLLVEQGALALDDPVASIVPAFAQHGKDDVRIRHLMTHTSGLPDMLPNNEDLRAAHASLERFIEETCRLPKLLFPPGTGVRYQSMGIALLAEVVHQISGVMLPEFLRREVFEPLGMNDTSLGWQPSKKDRIAKVHISPEQAATDWNWNTPYWLGFGAPWGGLITSPGDLAQLCRMMLGEGKLDDIRLLAPTTVRAMTSNQLALMPAVPEVDRRCYPWGLGWKLNGPGDLAVFSDLLGPRTYGHRGSTGTVCWIDPDTRTFAIIFTTEPQTHTNRDLVRLSNALAAALIS
jgi:CubicO group peptidase (beta-lactamase class C family)